MKKNSFIRTALNSLKIIWRASPSKLLLRSLFGVLHGISWVLEVIFTQYFFDAVQRLSEGQEKRSGCILGLLGMIIAVAFDQLMNGIDNCYGNIHELAFGGYINLQIFRRMDNMSCLEFEDVDRLDELDKVKTGGGKMFWVGGTLIDLICFYGTYFIFSGIYLFTLKPLLCISLLAAFIPSVISRSVQIRTFAQLEEQAAPVRRKCDYYEACAADIRETRLFSANKRFQNLFAESLRRLNSLRLAAQIKKQAISLLLDGITALGYGVVLYLVFVGVLRQEISIGAFAAVLASLTRMFNFMSEAITERYSFAVEDSAAAENFLQFMQEYTDEEEKTRWPEKSEMILNRVSFRYPNAKQDALHDVNLTIHPGETIALVGENGSGKTTLCRLLLGLYPPSEGSVKLNGLPVCELEKDRASAVFQNYNKYKMTLQDNIRMSCMEKGTTDHELNTLCRTAGVDLDNPALTDGVQTMLSREFDGAELSGGQWQRIAIARGLYRNADFIVLDEPTSAIDPLEETQLYQGFSELCKEKTAVIVTHRLGSARIADRIVVLKDGQIVEEGTHASLLQKNGEYSRMYAAQSQWYA